MSGHRRKPKRIVTVAAFVADVKQMRVTLGGYQRRLRVGCPHFEALWALDQALEATIRQIGGEEALAVPVEPGFMSHLGGHV